MSRERYLTVTDANGARGTFERQASPLESAAGATVAVSLEDGRVVQVPCRQLVERAGGQFTLLTSFEQFTGVAPSAGAERAAAGVERAAGDGRVGAAPDREAGGVVPVAEEQLRVGTREVETGRVRFTKRVLEDEVLVDEPVVREEVEIVRVPVGRAVDGPVPARQEGDTLIIPVLEEVLVVEKRLVLVEELHVRKRRVEESRPQSFTLRKEEVGVERLGASEESQRPAAEDFEPGDAPAAGAAGA